MCQALCRVVEIRSWGEDRCGGAEQLSSPTLPVGLGNGAATLENNLEVST